MTIELHGCVWSKRDLHTGVYNNFQPAASHWHKVLGLGLGFFIFPDPTLHLHPRKASLSTTPIRRVLDNWGRGRRHGAIGYCILVYRSSGGQLSILPCKLLGQICTKENCSEVRRTSWWNHTEKTFGVWHTIWCKVRATHYLSSDYNRRRW